ncbi:MAG TPA: tetratricopeptide repeat protein [Bacteroidia bacterium]|jgi:serine phosphatase RsbU (regulator of sigma subunit)
MKKILPLFLVFSSLLIVNDACSQNMDSLWRVYNNLKNPDTARVSALNDIAWNLLYTNPDSTYILGHIELEITKSKRLKKWETKALNTIGASYQVRGNYIKAIEFYQQSLKIREQLHDQKSVAASLANIGSIYINIGDFNKALGYQLRSLKLAEEIGNKESEASALNNIGIVYNNLSEYEKALDYNQRSLKKYEELGDQQGIAASYANIGNTYYNMGNHSPALECQLKSMKLSREIGDKRGESTSMTAVGKSYMKQKKFALALEYLTKAQRIAIETEDLDAEKEVTFALYETYKGMRNHSKALESYERHVVVKDSILKDNNQRQIDNKELEYQYEKKAAADSVRNTDERKVTQALIMAKNAQIDQDTTQRWALYGGLILLLLFGVLMYNRFRITSRQKNIIELKNKETERHKEIIEEKQKEILASISYAKRLQEAILPPQSLIKQHLPSSFFFYKPKDIVAGDFYWLEASLRHTDLLLFAAADCTGHGVPGAMVSVVCSNALNRTVKEFGITDPGKILDKVSELVVETFEKSESEVNDGMDISLCSLNKSTLELKWSGANNPLWLFRKNEFIEYKPNKQPIGKVDAPAAFVTHTIQLLKDDVLYLFTDGYADQFGGEKGKKFKLSSLQKLLLSNCHLPMDDQMKAVEATLSQWQGNIDQVDDILVVGIKI